MDEPDKKRRRINTEDGSVNRNDDKPKTNDAKIESVTVPEFSINCGVDHTKYGTKNKPGNFDELPKESDIADLSTMDFKIVKTKLTFVDKSKYIKSFFKCGASVIRITAPSRFGKSTFMDMLENFLKITVNEDAKPISNPEDGDNYKLFMNLQLGFEHPEFVKEHCGQYPVIFMSLKDVSGETKGDILESLKEALCLAFRRHSYLLDIAADGSCSFKDKKIQDIEIFLNYYNRNRLKELSQTNVEYGLRFLSEILYSYFNKKVVILIDETDAPIMKAIIENMDDKLLRYLINSISHLMSASLKDQKIVARALLNSCVRLSGVFSWELRNHCNVLFLQEDNFSGVYGFTVQEVDSLFEKSEFQAVKDSDGVKEWYDGYQILNSEETRIYSSWSVINYLQNSVKKKRKMFDSYWARSGFVDILGNLFVKSEIQKPIEKLLEDENIQIELAEPTIDNILELKKTICDSQNKLDTSQVNFFLQLLWDDGLLNAVEKNANIVSLKIPNWEIKSVIERKCYSQRMFCKKYKLEPENIEKYIQALRNLLLMANDEEETEKSKEKPFRELVNAVSGLFSDGATIPYNESELHHILFYLAYNSTIFSAQANRAVCQKNSKKKRGRKQEEFDMLVILRTVGAIFEWKYCKENETERSQDALKQIIDKQYFKVFDKEEYKYVKTKIYVGLCFKIKSNVTMRYLVNTTDVDKAKFLESTSTEATKADTATVVK